MKAEYPQLRKKIYFGDKKKKSLMIIWDDSDNEKSNNSNDEQGNICLMVDTNDKTKVKTCSKFDSSYASLDDEEEEEFSL